MEKDESLNVLGTELEECSTAPLTGFFREGSCDTNAQDIGSHTVCAVVTQEFLEFSRDKGNDLVTPLPCRVPYDHIPLRSYPLFKARHILEAMLSAHGYQTERT